MFTIDHFRALLNNQPFVPFRLHLSDGGFVDIRSREQVSLLRQFAFVALLDPQATDTVYDRFMFVWYPHVTRVEMLGPGVPPFAPPGGPAECLLPRELEGLCGRGQPSPEWLGPAGERIGPYFFIFLDSRRRSWRS